MSKLIKLAILNCSILHHEAQRQRTFSEVSTDLDTVPRRRDNPPGPEEEGGVLERGGGRDYERRPQKTSDDQGALTIYVNS